MKGPDTKPAVQLTRGDGNALVIISLVKRALRRAGADEQYINKYIEEANYHNVLTVSMKYTEVNLSYHGAGPSRWAGDTTCDICSRECSEVGEYMFDSPVDNGLWALTCALCFPKHRCSKMGLVYNAKTKEKITDIRNLND